MVVRWRFSGFAGHVRQNDKALVRLFIDGLASGFRILGKRRSNERLVLQQPFDQLPDLFAARSIVFRLERPACVSDELVESVLHGMRLYSFPQP